MSIQEEWEFGCSKYLKVFRGVALKPHGRIRQRPIPKEGEGETYLKPIVKERVLREPRCCIYENYCCGAKGGDATYWESDKRARHTAMDSATVWD